MCARTHRPQLPPTIVGVHSRPGPTLPHASRPRIQARGPHHAGRREPSACARVARSHVRLEFVSWRVRLPIIQRNARPPALATTSPHAWRGGTSAQSWARTRPRERVAHRAPASANARAWTIGRTCACLRCGPLPDVRTARDGGPGATMVFFSLAFSLSMRARVGPYGSVWCTRRGALSPVRALRRTACFRRRRRGLTSGVILRFFVASSPLDRQRRLPCCVLHGPPPPPSRAPPRGPRPVFTECHARSCARAKVSYRRRAGRVASMEDRAGARVRLQHSSTGEFAGVSRLSPVS